MSSIMKARALVSSIYDVNFSNEKEKHELGAGEDLDEKV